MTDHRWQNELSPAAKRLLLEQMLAGRVGRPKVYPASFPQRRLWFFEQMEPGTGTYNNCVTLDLRGPLDRVALAQALAEVARRHESLRTTFEVRDGEPVQVISPEPSPSLSFDDLAGASGICPAEGVEQHLLEESLAPFDLARGPLLRARLLRVADDHHVLAVTVHHIVSDGWSIIVVLLRELLLLYRAASTGEPAVLPPLPMQYGEFAVWQRDVLRGTRLDKALAFWRSTLGVAPEPLHLPTDHPRPRVQTYRGQTHSRVLGAAVSEGLQRLAQGHGVTPFMGLLAVFGALLGRLSGQERVIVGSPITGRTLSEVEGLVGFFVNTLPLPVDLGADASYEQLLRAVSDTSVRAYEHQELPFDRLVEELHPARDLGRTPLFQVMLNMLGFVRQDLDLVPGLDVALRTAPMATSKFDLTLYATPGPDGYSLLLASNADLFDGPRMDGLLEQYATLLEQAVARPELPMRRHGLAGSSARRVLPDPASPLGKVEAASLLGRLSRTARESRARMAVRSAGEDWTYERLEESAARLAAALGGEGLGRGDVVAIWARRDPLLVCAVIGVLKAGAAFAILDPSYPSARLAACWRACAAKGLLLLDGAPPIPAELAEQLRTPAPPVRLVVNAATIGAGDVNLEPTESEETIDADMPAYVAFTSGTTGGVKAILGTHGPLVHFLEWHTRTFSLGPGDHFAMLSGLSHDPLLRDLLTPLWVGATLHVPDAERVGEPGWLAGWLVDEGVTVAHMTPAMAELVASGPRVRSSSIECLRWAFFGGDVLTRGAVNRFGEVAPNCKSVNFYGATETPQAMAYHVVSGGAAGRRSETTEVLPLGRGIDDVQVLVLNTLGVPAGVGELGEIVVRTRHLARGYLGDDALTRERFAVNPFTRDAGDRIYRTGDLGRYRPDGEVDFAGRRDAQVKVRGFRVELGEIEAALREHGGVRDAVAALSEATPGDRRLAAFVVPANPGGVNWAELKEFLRARLPEHSVPSAWATIEAVPLTPNGKVDRRRLPAPTLTRLLGAENNPRTPTEELLADVWSAVLGVPRIGRDDAFFDLGGHSLLATQVLSRVRERLGVALPVRALFEAPTLAALAARVDEARRGAKMPQPPLSPLPSDQPFPLSFGQQRLWFLHELEPASAAYNLAGALELRGDLSTEALEGALSAIVARHEALRTAFGREDGEPVQRVLPPEPVCIRRVEPAEGGESLDALMAEEVTRPFDLAAGGVLRSTVYRVGEREWVLLLVAHHIASDGWSMGVFTRELSTFYEAIVEGRDLTVAPLPVQYRDYAVWQRRWLQGDVLEEQVMHWRSRLEGAPRVLELPADRPRPPMETHHGARVSFTLPRSLSMDVAALGRRHGATLYMTLLAAFDVLLSRHAGQEDLLVGSPVANRSRAEIESLIGFFVNTLVLRGDLRGDPTFEELLARVREDCLDAYAHQDLPFEKLVEELRPERDLSRNPVVQVMFALQNVPASDVHLKGVSIRSRDVSRGAAQVDLALFLRETSEGLAGTFEYATDLFERTSIVRLVDRFRTLLEGIVADSGRRVSELPLLTEGERGDLEAWNATTAEVPEVCVHDAISERAARSPDRVAVESAEGQLTFGNLEGRAEQLAGVLRARGVGPGALVGVYMERGLEMLVALLGVWKAGAAYVPLDPGFPSERLSYMVEDSQAALVLTQTGLLGSVPTRSVPALVVDEAAMEGAAGPGLSERRATPDNLAYVIYTSGSTGRPKGVAISHRALLNLLLSMGREPGLSEGDVLLSVTTLSFDIAALELYLPLLVGARVYVASREDGLDGRRLSRLLGETGATVMQATPATWRMLIESGWEGTPGLKVLCGGEGLPRELAEELLSRASEVWNVYGPTETTVWSSAERVRSGEGPVSIGRPIANTRMFVLDRHLRPVPVGVAGELYIGGMGLARGYWRRPELTAEKFVADPLSGASGERVYRTGDLARWLPDGRLECLGRVDSQVKVRGFRIELGEIEAVLAEHGGVAEAVVVAQEAGSGDRRLVAFLTSRVAPAPTAVELREHLGRTLPAYMVPSAYEFVDRLPLTPNGKVDRKALAQRSVTGEVECTGYTAPRTPTEEVLARIWAEVLEVERVGVEDDFFALGGHSLLATRLTSRIRQALGVELPLREIFTLRTLSGVASEIDRRLVRSVPAGKESRLVAQIPKAEGAERGALTAMQQQLWFFSQLQPRSTAYNLGFQLKLEGHLDPESLERALRVVVDRHESLRTRFVTGSGRPEAVIAAHLDLPLHQVDLLGMSESEREHRARRALSDAAGTPFDLSVGPLVRALLVRLSEESHVLGLTFHHIVCDGWSVSLVVEELLAAYTALVGGRRPDLPGLPIQYADYAVWQQRWLLGEEAANQSAYWREKLAGELPVVDLPRDHSRPVEQTFQAGSCSLTVDSALTRALSGLAHRRGATPFMALLAAFSIVVKRLTGLDDLPLGMAIAGRVHRETERLVGVFTNTVVVRQDLSGDPSFTELLERTREATLEAHLNGDLPFQAVVESVRPHRDPGRTPLFQVLVNSVDFGVSRRVQTAGLSVEIGAAGSETAKFDATLYLGEEAGATVLNLVYNRDLYSVSRMEGLLRQVEAVVEQATAAPERRISTISLVPPFARKALPDPTVSLGGWSGPPLGSTLPDHARRTPGRQAVVGAEGSLDYSAVDRLSLRLAGRLRVAGVGPGDLVAIYARRCPELVWGLMGILRAGAGFVVLDSAHPAVRTIQCLEAARPRAWLECGDLESTGPLAEAISRLSPVLRERLVSSLQEGAPGDDDSHGGGVDGQGVAYVAFTSGTTGAVKGIVGEHGPVSHFVEWHVRTFGLCSDDRFSMLSGLSHDPLLRDVFTPLEVGASLHVPDPDLILAPGGLRSWMAREAITVAHLTPSLARVLTEGADEAEVPSLRLAFFGGDVLTLDVVERMRIVAPRVRIVNFYGATETPQAMGWHEVEPDGGDAAGSRPLVQIPIGKGIDGVQILVLGDGTRLAGIGEVGEVAIRTPHLARGYLGDDELTRSRFVDNPFSGEAGDRLYLSGDLGRFRPDGSVEFAGRRDGQVKIRGYRVEIEAVERALREHPAVSQAAVAVAGGSAEGAADARLVAYCVHAAGQQPTVTELRRYLRDRLPDYMVPSAFVSLDALPLTPNGKIDRKALVGSGGGLADVNATRRPPQTPAERLVAEVWGDALGVRDVRATDNFFDLGGHSLLAVRVLSLLEVRVGRSIHPREMLYQTLEQFAAGLDLAPPQTSRPQEAGPVSGMLRRARRWLLGWGGGAGRADRLREPRRS